MAKSRRPIGLPQTMLERSFSSGGVHLVTVPIDYSENERVLVRELRARFS